MIHKTTLDNGIRVLTEEMPGVHSVTLGIWVLSGSRNETLAQNGISHFWEHMLFKGTQTRSARDIAVQIDSVGGVLNAFTSREYCCFHVKLLSDKLPLAIDLLADIVLNSALNPDEIEKERRVIRQEILSIEGDPEESSHELFCRQFWHNHSLGRPIQGTLDSVNHLSRNDLLDYIAGHLLGENLLVCVAGNLIHAEVVRQIAEAFSALPKKSHKQVVSIPLCGSGLTFNERDLEQIHLCLGLPALPQSHPQRFVVYLINTILGGSMSCRLFQKIREEQALAYSIYSYLNCHSDAGALVIYSATSNEHAARVVHLMLKELQRLSKVAVSAQELSSAKEQLKGSLLLSIESSDSRMIRLAKNEIYLGQHPTIQDIVKAFDAVSQDDVLRLAGELFRDDVLNLQMIGRTSRVDFPRCDLTLG